MLSLEINWAKESQTGAEKKWSIKHAKKRKIDSEAIHEVIELLTEKDSDNEIQSTTKWKQIDDMWLTKEDRYNYYLHGFQQTNHFLFG